MRWLSSPNARFLVLAIAMSRDLLEQDCLSAGFRLRRIGHSILRHMLDEAVCMRQVVSLDYYSCTNFIRPRCSDSGVR